MPLVVVLLSLLVLHEYRDLPLSAAVAVDMVLDTTAGGVVSVATEAIFYLAVLAKAQRHTTLLTPVCHGRRACTPPCSMRVVPGATAVVYYCYPSSAAVVCVAAVTLLAASGSWRMLLPPPPFSLLQLQQALLIFFACGVDAAPSSYVCAVSSSR